MYDFTDKSQTREFLLGQPFERFVNWHNDLIVDPFGENSFCFIQPNDLNEVAATICDNMTPGQIIKLGKDSHYSDDDDYAIVYPSGLFSFNTVAEFLDSENGQEAIEFFMEYVDESLAYFEEK